jgi:hypothetical protein
MSTAIPGKVWRPTSAEQVQHLGLVEETGNQGDFKGRAYRKSSKNSNFVAISSFVVKLLKKCRVR